MLGAHSILPNFIAALILGATINPIYSLLIAYTNDHLPTEKMSSASGGFVLINGLGAMIGPIAVGYLMGVFGPPGFFGFMGLLSATIAAYALYRITQRAAPAPEETGTFVPMPTRGQVMVEMASEIYAEDVEDTDSDIDSTDPAEGP